MGGDSSLAFRRDIVKIIMQCETSHDHAKISAAKECFRLYGKILSKNCYSFAM
jgi:hypothetical protein